jgi:pSer/pThr/pTyr-binding forkhead associated (FHA) protein
MSCPACGGATPSGFPFCQRCGAALATTSGQGHAAASGEVVAAAVAVLPTVAVTPPAGLRRVPGEPSLRLAPVPVLPEPATRCLVALAPDGGVAARYPLVGAVVDLGRSEGDLRFAADDLLAPRHARIELDGGAAWIVPIDRENGVFLRVRDRIGLRDGDHLLVGRQLLRFEAIATGERTDAPVLAHGVRLLGSPPRACWGRVCELSAGRLPLDVHGLSGTEIVIGRLEGQIRFPDDDQLAARHALIRSVPSGAELSDLGSPGGTFVRLRDRRALDPGDVFRLGTQILRFEAA